MSTARDLSTIRTLVDLLANIVDARAQIEHCMRLFERELGRDIDNLAELVNVLEPPIKAADLDWLIQNAQPAAANKMSTRHAGS